MKRLLKAASLASILVLVPVLSVAQPAPTPAAQPTPTPGAVETKKPKRGTDLTLGLAYQGPTRLTGSATLMWGTPRMFGAWAPGKLAQVRVGARGGQFGLGFVAGAFEDSVKPSGVGVSLKAIVLRTWRDPTGLTNGHSYAGVESDVILLGFRGSIGYARRVGGQGGPDGRFIWSLGLGL